MDVRLNLDDLRLRGGQRHESTFEVETAPIVAGGARFDVVVAASAEVRVDRVAGGYLVSLKLDAKVCGPCSRCLKEACEDVHAAQEEFVPTAEGGWSESESSPFVEGRVVDLVALSREAVVLGMPDRMLCSEECRGLCSMCGANLNEGRCECQPLEV